MRLSPYDFGGVGDGNADDTEALQATFEHARNHHCVIDLAGQWKFTEPIATWTDEDGPLCVEGGNPWTCELRQGADLGDSAAITLRGRDQRLQFCTLSGVLFRNPHGQFKGDALRIDRADRVHLQNVFFIAIRGHAIRASNYWDSSLHRITVQDCGTPDKPAASFGSSDGTAENGCNNLTWTACQFEANLGTQLLLDTHTRACQFVGCKWHGTQGRLAVADHVVMRGALRCSFTGCNFAMSGRSHLVMETGSRGAICKGNQILGGTFDNAKGTSVILTGKGHSLVGSAFGMQAANRQNLLDRSTESLVLAPTSA